jgi:enoyl-[acyl-carrier protein] reductase / trans-2-enoyl-CoA reductase (NAD+)
MIIKPRVRGFICTTAHPVGCAVNVGQQVRYVVDQGQISGGPKNVLVVGASTGYGLASRIVAAFGCGAATLGVYYERPPEATKAATAGWYNSAALEKLAHEKHLYAKSINGDAFSDAIKTQTVNTIKKDLGSIDLLIYSLASPRRTHPKTGVVYDSALKPVGKTFTGKSLNTDKEVITEVSIEPATPEEIENTKMVMGGEDWRMWIDALAEAGLLAKGFQTIAYSYIGPEVTWDIYKNGSIGVAKDDVKAQVPVLDTKLAPVGGKAYVSMNKAVVTQASSAIPVVPLYISLLFKIMKEKGTQEGCIEQMHRMFATQLYNGKKPALDAEGMIRMDDLELADDVQAKIKEIWPKVTSENFHEMSDFKAYRHEFLRLFGFDIAGIDYDAEVDPVTMDGADGALASVK